MAVGLMHAARGMFRGIANSGHRKGGGQQKARAWQALTQVLVGFLDQPLSSSFHLIISAGAYLTL